jgi:hypothetical protein
MGQVMMFFSAREQVSAQPKEGENDQDDDDETDNIDDPVHGDPSRSL